MKMRFKGVLFAAVAAMGLTAMADGVVKRFDSHAEGGAGDGSSWANAYTSIADAIAAVAEAGGGEVWVKQGTHTFAQGTGFSLRSGVTVLGGFKGEDGTDDAVRDPAEYVTTLAGVNNNNENDRIISQAVACDNTAVLDGVTLTQSRYAYRAVTANARPLFRNCLFSGKAGICSRSGDGATGSSADFVGCRFVNLSGGSGYGIINIEGVNASVTFTDCVISDTTALGKFGIVAANGGVSFTRCQFLRNTTAATGNQAALICRYDWGDVDFVDCKLLWNTVPCDTGIAIFRRMTNCLIASNTVASATATAGRTALLGAGISPVLLYRCSIFDNSVDRKCNVTVSGSVVSTLIYSQSSSGHLIVDTTIARNAFTASAAEGTETIASTLYFDTKFYAGIANCAFVDNEAATADVWTKSDTGRKDTIIVNSLFRNKRSDYVPLVSVPGYRKLAVYDSVVQNLDETHCTLATKENVSVAEPLLYAPVNEGLHFYYPIRTGSVEAGPVAHGIEMDSNGYCRIAGIDKTLAENSPSGTLTFIDDLLGNARSGDAFTMGPIQGTLAKSDMLVVRAAVTPVGAGTLTGPTEQNVPAHGSSVALTAAPSSDAISFLGWRVKGTETIFDENATLNLADVTDDWTVEAVFGTPKVKYTFNLGSAGTFDENNEPTIVVEYDIGDKPSVPAWTPDPRFYAAGWDIQIPDVVTTEPVTMTMRSIEMIHRIVRYDSAAADGGDGESWAKAMNTLTGAVAKAGLWTGEVWVKGGTHTLTEDGFSLPRNVAVRGGFAGVDGAFETVDAERAARNPAAHPSVLRAKDLKSNIISQTATESGTGVFDGLTFTDSQYAYYCDRTENTADQPMPTFTNCVFTGAASVFVRTREYAGAANFRNCVFTNLTGGTTWGRIHIESTYQPTFTDCLFVDNKVDNGFGLLHFTNTSVVFLRCRFVKNIASSGEAIADDRGTDWFYDCDFIGNESTSGAAITCARQMVDCVVASNVVRSANGKAALVWLNAGVSSLYRCSVFDNTVVCDMSAKEGADAVATLFDNGNNRQTLVDSTVARNVCRAIPGEGGSAVGGILYWTGTTGGGVLNCTFAENEVTTAELIEASRAKGNLSQNDIVVVNSLFGGAKNGGMPLKTLAVGTDVGVLIRNSVFVRYDAGSVNCVGEENLFVEPTLTLSTMRTQDRHRYYQPPHGSKAFRGALDVSVGENNRALGYRVSGFTATGWNDVTCSSYDPMPDLLGAERPLGKSTIGARQLGPAGIVIFFH